MFVKLSDNNCNLFLFSILRDQSGVPLTFRQVTIDKRYQPAIMVLLRRHDPSVPCEPCAPAKRYF